VQEQELRQPQTAQQAQQMRQEQQARTTQREQPRRQASVSRSSSQDIREAQRALNKMGFDAGSVDGVWGPNTAAAIRNFQQSRGIEATGRLNDRTMEELGIQGGQQVQQNR
jgi:peptidoglycan hydrolase-like protein with peptidoglycan-binding domain